LYSTLEAIVETEEVTLSQVEMVIFGNRVINVWNFPDYIVTSTTVTFFTHRLAALKYML